MLFFKQKITQLIKYICTLIRQTRAMSCSLHVFNKTQPRISKFRSINQFYLSIFFFLRTNLIFGQKLCENSEFGIGFSSKHMVSSSQGGKFMFLVRACNTISFFFFYFGMHHNMEKICNFFNTILFVLFFIHSSAKNRRNVEFQR